MYGCSTLLYNSVGCRVPTNQPGVLRHRGKYALLKFAKRKEYIRILYNIWKSPNITFLSNIQIFLFFHIFLNFLNFLNNLNILNFLTPLEKFWGKFLKKYFCTFIYNFIWFSLRRLRLLRLLRKLRKRREGPCRFTRCSGTGLLGHIAERLV